MVSFSLRKPHFLWGILSAMPLVVGSLAAWGQTPSALDYSLATPRPISPAEGTTNPSAQATQNQNPYLGSVPSFNVAMISLARAMGGAEAKLLQFPGGK